LYQEYIAAEEAFNKNETKSSKQTLERLRSKYENQLNEYETVKLPKRLKRDAELKQKRENEVNAKTKPKSTKSQDQQSQVVLEDWLRDDVAFYSKGHESKTSHIRLLPKLLKKQENRFKKIYEKFYKDPSNTTETDIYGITTRGALDIKINNLTGNDGEKRNIEINNYWDSQNPSQYIEEIDDNYGLGSNAMSTLSNHTFIPKTKNYDVNRAKINSSWTHAKMVLNKQINYDPRLIPKGEEGEKIKNYLTSRGFTLPEFEEDVIPNVPVGSEHLLNEYYEWRERMKIWRNDFNKWEKSENTGFKGPPPKKPLSPDEIAAEEATRREAEVLERERPWREQEAKILENRMKESQERQEKLAEELKKQSQLRHDIRAGLRTTSSASDFTGFTSSSSNSLWGGGRRKKKTRSKKSKKKHRSLKKK
jgi:hypothetical protein